MKDNIAGMTLLLVACLITTQCTYAGECTALYRQRVVKQVVVKQAYVAQAYVAPVQAYVAPLYYAVSPGLQADAVAEKAAERAVAKIRAEFGALRKDPRVPATMLSSKCAKCHNAQEPKGGVVLDGSEPVDDATFRQIVQMLGTGKGVPKAMQGVIAGLQPAEKGQITEELLGLEQAPHRDNQPRREEPEPGVLE